MGDIPDQAPDFDDDRRALGLSGPNFDYFFEEVKRDIREHPWRYTVEIPNSGGIRMRRTREAYMDIPPLYVYYRVDPAVYLGLSPAWSSGEVGPPTDP